MVKENSDALPAGYKLKGSQYEIKRLLGDGGFGLTYLAYDQKNKREVAIKEFFPDSYARRIGGNVMLKGEKYQNEYDECWKDFQDEAKALAYCKHVGVVERYDDFEEHGTDYLVMQFIEGQQLGDWIKQDGSDFLSQVLPPILDALEYIHNKDLVHRDIKPENIIVRSGNNQPVLIDFGSTRLDYNRDQKSATIPTTKTYAAPELLSDDDLGNATPASDLYALAVMLYKYVTDYFPQKSLNRLNNDQLGSVHKKVKPEFIHHAGLLNAIDAALIMHPKNRLQTISEFRAMLKEDQSLDKDSVAPSILIERPSEHGSGDTPEDASELNQSDPEEIDPAETEAPHSPLRKRLFVFLMLLIAGSVWAYNGNITNEGAFLATGGNSGHAENKITQIAKLERLARDAVSKMHYSKPQGKSALDYIKQIRGIAPDDVRIGELAKLVVAGYLKLAEARLSSAPSKASLFIEQARKTALRYGLTTSQTNVNYMAGRLKEGMFDKNILEKFFSEMVIIPGGSFQMGSKSFKDSIPIHMVQVNNFKMNKYEVTQAQWKAVMGSNPSYRKGDDLPVANVSWNKIETFINKLNEQAGQRVRLPSEAEWEFAVRAGGVGKSSWGDREAIAASYAWYEKNANKRTHLVGQKKPNAFGLYDMHGNVWEWVEDCWNSSYKDAPTDGSAWLFGKCGKRVFRGGSYNNSRVALQSAYRNEDDIDKKYSNVGFRLAQDVTSEEIALAKKMAVKAKLTQITKLERLARDAISKVRYSKPQGKSALDYIEKIRAVASDDARITELAKLVVAGYFNLAERYLNKNKVKASIYLEGARKVASAYGLNDDGLLARFDALAKKLNRISVSSDETDQRVHNRIKERQAANCDAMTEDFIDHADGTVTDKKTGLMWKKCSEGLSGSSCRRGAAHKYSWAEALQYAKQLNSDEGFAMYRDWHVPTRKELNSIHEDTCTIAPTLNSVVFPGSESSGYWSSTEKGISFYYSPLQWLIRTPQNAFVVQFDRDSDRNILACRNKPFFTLL